MKNFYQILSVSPSASLSEIKSAFRQLAKNKHPDLNFNDPQTTEEFKNILEAYKVLSNPDERKKYDELLNTGVGMEKRGYTQHNIDDIYANVISTLAELNQYRFAAIRYAFWGCVWLIVGLSVTIISYINAVNSGGGRFVIAYGAVIFGFIQAANGFSKAREINKAIKNIKNDMWDCI